MRVIQMALDASLAELGQNRADEVVKASRGIQPKDGRRLCGQPGLVADQASLLRTRDIIGLRPSEKIGAGASHVAGTSDEVAVSRRLTSSQPLHAHGRIQAQEDDKVIEWLEGRSPLQRAPPRP